MNHIDTVTRHSTMNTTLEHPVNRRHLLKLMGLGSAALALGAAGGAEQAAARSTDSLIVTTAGARLRSGPGTGYTVLASLAKGTEVRYLADGGSANGYRWYNVLVLATGTEGFMASSLLSAPGSSTPDPVIVGTATTTSAVNLRTGPSTAHQVLRVVASGVPVQISSTVQNGYRYVVHNGLAGWIADQYLASGVPGDGPYDPSVATTTSALNLRAEPSLRARVLLVMPSGARVRMLGGGSGQFAKVEYNGTVGWAAYAYLH